MNDGTPTPTSTGRRSAFLHAAIALAWCAVAAWPRARDFDRLGLVHYDEGVYAESAASVRAGKGFAAFHPQQALHAPPLTAVAGGLLARVCDVPASQGLILLSILCGAATVGLLYFGVARAVGTVGGCVAAIGVCWSGAHVLWSRTALTDAPHGLAFLAAVFAAARLARRPSFGAALGAGLAAAVALNVKYHVGWIALAAGACAAAPGIFAADKAERRRLLVLWATAFFVAFLGVLPWAFSGAASVADAGGSVATQHGRFFEPAHWWRNLVAQLGYATKFPGPHWPAALGVLGLGGFAAFVRKRDASPLSSGATLGYAAAALALVTPAYHPYPRLAVPFALCVTAGIGRVVGGWTDRPGYWRSPEAPIFASCAAIGGFLALFGATDSSGAERARGGASDGLRVAALTLAAKVPPGEPLYVLAEPNVAAHLREAGFDARNLGHPWQVDEAVPKTASGYVVSGFYVRRNREWDAWEAARRVKTELLGEAAALVSDARRFDDFLPQDVRSAEALSDETYRLELRRLPPR
jgi:hypothetical protein